MRVLAIDQGTSATKAIVVDDGRLCALAEVPVHPEFLSGGRVEQDPGELLASVLEAGGRAVADAGGAVDAVALANQGETVLAWDRASGEPLTTAIVWQDGRAQSVCDAIAANDAAAADIAARTGLVLDPYFSAPKMTWIREHLTNEGVVTTTDTWLVHALTGAFVTDATTASRSLVLDLDRGAWDDSLLARFGLGGECLPDITACDEVVGTTTRFGGEIPVAGLMVDQQAALFAEGCLTPGDAKCTYGTGAFLLANSGTHAVRSVGGLTTSIAWALRGTREYCLDGQVFTAASAIRWLVDLGILDDVRALDAASADDSEGVRCCPALAGLGAPWWRSDARAAFTGLTLATTRGHLVRAVIEGIAAQVAGLVAVIAADTGVPVRRLRVDGGLTHSAVLMQAQADLLQAPVEVYPSAHATALGAAAMCRLALDPDLAVAGALGGWRPAAVYEPRWSADRSAAFLGEWRAAVDRQVEDGAP